MGEGQYEVGDELAVRLDELDDLALAALEAGDEAVLDGHLDAMWKLVKAQGTALADDDLRTSDVHVPPSDLTLAETRALLSEQGLIPDIPTR
jgi:hypothetical protein